MIKPNELRIGNLFHPTMYSNGIRVPQSTIAKIITIDAFHCLWLPYDWNPAKVVKWNESKYGEIEPIPLTSERLLKFGFTEVDTPTFENIKLKYYCKNAVCLFFNGSPPENTYLTGHGFNVGRDYYASTAKWIDSVHELQNYYYALTGEELTIEE